MDVKEILERLSDYFQLSDPTLSALRYVIWLFIKLLFWVIHFLEKAVEQVYTLGGLVESDKVNAIVSSVMPFAWALLAVAILVYGYQIMTGNNVFKTQTIQNVLLAIGLITLLPWMLIQLNSLTISVFEWGKSDITNPNIVNNVDGNQMQDNDGNTSTNTSTNKLGVQILKSNIVDILWVANHDYELDPNGMSNHITQNNINNIKINERINMYNGKDSQERELNERLKDYGLNEDDRNVFKQYIETNFNGEKVLSDVPFTKLTLIGEVEMLSQWYYRYTWNSLALILQMGAVGLALAVTTFKVVRLWMEITFAKIIAPFVATVDLSTGQRIRNLIKDILLNYSALALIPFVMQLYIIGVGWTSAQDFNWLVTSVIMIAMSYFLIDGPDIAKKILGVDLGVQDGWRMMMGTAAGVGLGVKGAKSIGSTAAKGIGALQNPMAKAEDKLAPPFKKGVDNVSNGMSNLGSAATKDIANGVGKGLKTVSGKATDSFAGTELGQKTYKTALGAKEKMQDAKDAMTNVTSAVGATAVAQGIKSGAEAVGAVYSGERDSFKNPNKADVGFGGTDSNSTGTIPNQQLSNTLQSVQSNLNANDPQSAVRNVTDLMNEASGSEQDRQQLINGLMANVDASEAQQRLNGVLEGITDPQAKQQMISSLMANDNVGIDQKNRLVNDVMSGAVEGSQARMVHDIVSGMSSSPEQRQQVIEAMMSNSSVGAEAKQQLVDQVLANRNMDADTKTQLLTTMTSGNISSESQRQMVEQVLSKGNLDADTKTQVLNAVAGNVGNVETQRQMVEQVLSKGNVDADTRTQVLNAVTSGSSSQEVKTQMIQEVVSGSASPQTRTQLMNEISSSSAANVEQKMRHVTDVLSSNESTPKAVSQLVQTINGQSSDPKAQTRMINEVLSGKDSSTGLKTQFIQSIVGNANTPMSAKQQVVNSIFSGKGNNLTDKQQSIIQNVLSGNQSSETKTAYIQTLTNPVKPVAENQTTFLKQVMESGIESGTKSQIVNQLIRPISSRSPETISQQINQVMNSTNVSTNLKNNIVNELTRPNSVYKTDSNLYRDKLRDIDEL